MDQSTSNSAPTRPSGLPRLSRLPVPRAVRPSASRDNLQQSSRTGQGPANPRLRSTPSRDQLSTSTTPSKRLSSLPSKPFNPIATASRDSDSSAGTLVYKPLNQSLLRKPSSDVLYKRPVPPSTRQHDQMVPASGEGDMTQEYRISPVERYTEDQPMESQVPRKSRPSLSERTMETLQNIPSSPLRKRTSNFFNRDSPTPPPSDPTSRPGSGHENDVPTKLHFRSVSSRPGSSSSPRHSIPPDFRASTNTFKLPETTMQTQTPLKRPSTAKSLKTPSSIRSVSSAGLSKLPSATFISPDRERSPSPVKPSTKSINPIAKPLTLKYGSKTLNSRPLNPRGSVNGLFRKPSMPSLDQSAESDRIGIHVTKTSPSVSNTSSEGTIVSRASRSTAITSESSDDQSTNIRKSSAALREQIAKAKAAKRATVKPAAFSEEQPVIPSDTFDFGLSQDPFNHTINQSGVKGLLRKRINAARTDGRLNIAAMGFKEIPDEVMNMYNLESIGAQDGSWAESVDLTRFVAADNELELLNDDVFPDVDPRTSMDDDEARGNQFCGLETLDLHGNVLKALPLGLRRLELLTALNLSNNKLDNSCFEVISQIPSLRDLKIGGNNLSGTLDSSIGRLQSLEILDIQRNELTSLSEGLTELRRLRVLNIKENQFLSLPFVVLQHLPLIELLASKNKLSGVLVAADIEQLPQLQILDVTSNALTALTTTQLQLPALHQLSCSSNHLTNLPDMTSWLSLLTLAAEDNNITAIPEGFVMLPKVKNVNFSGNNLKVLDDRIGGMETLDIFRISGNPLRERKFAGMTTEDLKRALQARIVPVEQETLKEKAPEEIAVDAEGNFYTPPMSPARPSSSEWPVKDGGILDRSSTQSSSLNPVIASRIAAENAIRVLELHRNSLKEIPSSIAFFAATLTSLNLSHNELSSDTFLKDDLELPALKELNMSSNTFNSVQPLIKHLFASQLEKLDISFNRLTSLPALRLHFPRLTILLASNNTIRELSPEAVKGLRVLDCNSNDINSLNARIGLLGGPGGLERLDVSGNRFRVPKYTILEKGTEATLAWLRDRIPAGDTSLEDVD